MNFIEWLKQLLGCKEKELAEVIQIQIEEINELKNQLEPQINPLENFWNSKYPQAIITYSGRWLKEYGQMDFDIRGFYQNDVINELQKIITWGGFSDDEKALACQRWVANNITYVPDKTQFGLDEYWELPQETLLAMRGDCDDGAILMANLMEASGIPYWKIRLACGDVYNQNGEFMGGHCFVTYFVEKSNYWVAMDWCFYPDIRPVEQRGDYKDSILYGKGKTWFSWNSKYAFYKFTVDSGNNSYLKNFKIV
jgi:transglutaminase-like putative cysteine protease